MCHGRLVNQDFLTLIDMTNHLNWWQHLFHGRQLKQPDLATRDHTIGSRVMLHGGKKMTQQNLCNITLEDAFSYNS